MPRSQPGGPSLLINSTWLVYVVYLTPVIGLGAMILMIVLLAYNWRLLSDALGYGIAGRRKAQRKKQSRSLSIVIWMGAWLIAIQVLLGRCGGIFCKPSQDANFTTQVKQFVTGSTPASALPFIQTIAQLGTIIQTSWFSIAFIGLAVVSSVIIVRALTVSWDESRQELAQFGPQAEGIQAVEDAIHIIESRDSVDPRTRIIDCYQRMIQAAQQLGASVTSDRTARELEIAIRKMLLVKGPAIRDLTELFEEARYSQHEITEEHGEKAHEYLLSIAEEMRIPVSV